MEKDAINGQMDDLIQEIGFKIKCMAKVCLLGLMAEFTKANMYMIKNRDMVFSHGQMGEPIKGIGKMENNMEKAAIKEVKMKKNEVNGMREEELNGWKMPHHNDKFIKYI